MTYCDVEKAYSDGTLSSLPDETLREMELACLKTSGPNTTRVQGIHKMTEIIRAELNRREERRSNAEVSAELSTADAVLEIPAEIADSADHWAESRLNEMIRDQIEESLSVEYKAAGAISRDKTGEITKDVSSFANSAGGCIFYGIAESKEKDKRHLPDRLDPIKRSEYSKEWLEHIIGEIRPRISDIRIHSVQLGSSPDHLVYVVVIPQGKTAHQATDGRYYRRYNFESVRMADHEIRDIMHRTTALCRKERPRRKAGFFRANAEC